MMFIKDALAKTNALIKGNIRVLTVRNVSLTLIAGLTGGLDSLFVKEILGADAVALGFLSSIWSLIFLIFILFGGWVSDNYGRKRMLILGTAITTPIPLIFALAPDWRVITIANLLGAVGAAISAPAYVSILFSSSRQESRSRSIAAINTLNNLANVIVPPLGALTIHMLGGLRSIRMIYLLQFPLSIIILLYTHLKLEDRPVKAKAKRGILEASREALNQIVKMYRISRKRKASSWLLMSITGPWAWETVGPFWVIYAAEVCGSPLYILGLLPAVYSLTASLMLLPLAEISDKRGRKKVILMMRPFIYLCILLLIAGGTIKELYDFSWVAFIPLVAWILRAIGESSGPAWTAISTEVIPEELQSEWEATRDFLWRVMSIPACMVGGLLWNIDPRLPFILALAVDGLIRFPILIFNIPETVIRRSPIYPAGPRIILYGLPGSGRTTIARLVRQRLSVEIVDEGTMGLGGIARKHLLKKDKEIYRRLQEVSGKEKRTIIIEGEPAFFAAKQKDQGIIVLLVASRDERARRRSMRSKEPEFVAFKELEDEDREVAKIIRRLHKADISKLPPFDIAINTDRIPPEKAAKVISFLLEKEKSETG